MDPSSCDYAQHLPATSAVCSSEPLQYHTQLWLFLAKSLSLIECEDMLCLFFKSLCNELLLFQDVTVKELVVSTFGALGEFKD